MDASPKYVVYYLSDHRTGAVRYVGKSSSGMIRPRVHLRSSTLKVEAHTYKARWISSLVREGIVPTIGILVQFDNHVSLVEAEKFWIGYLRLLGCKLTNLTDGGEGAPGYRQSPETRAKRAASMRGRAVGVETREKLKKFNLGRHPSLETKKKISWALTGHTQSLESRERKSSSLRKWSFSREKIRRPVIQKQYVRGGFRPGAPQARPIVDQEGQVYASVGDASRCLGLDRAAIRRVLQKKQHAAGGWFFQYVGEQK